MRRSRKSLRESLHRMLIERARKLCQPRGQLQSLRLSFNYFASCDGNIRVVEFLWLMRIAPRADFEFCSTKKKSWNVFTGASLFRGLLREILFLLFPRVTIRSYRMKLPFFCCSKEKTIYFRNHNLYSIKIRAISFNDFFPTRFSTDISHFYKTLLWFQREEILRMLRLQFLEYFMFSKPIVKGETSDNRLAKTFDK